MTGAHRRGATGDASAWIAKLAGFIENNELSYKEWPDIFDFGRIHALSGNLRAAHERFAPLIAQRGRLGLVRHCHGDCHLANIALIDDRPVLFDALEFDDTIATVDVLYDLSFPLADLWQRGDKSAANRLLIRYLTASGEPDHLEGLAALPFYMAMVAAIRANVTASRMRHLDERDTEKARQRAIDAFDLAEALIEPAQPRLVAVGGLSGTGKTTLAMAIAPLIGAAPGAIVLRSDIERKVMLNAGETDRLPASGYTSEVTKEVYHRLYDQARAILASGHSVIVDAVFARPEERDAIAQIADAVEVPFEGLWLEASRDLMTERVSARRNDASDADAEVVREQSDYEIGDMNWRRVDASGDAAGTAKLAADLLELP